MALLEELDFGPGQDKFPDAYDKINQAIQTINSVLAGGGAGYGIRKSSNSDFDFEFYDTNVSETAEKAKALTDGTYTIREKVYPIGSWDMDANDNVFVEHDLGPDITKIVEVTAIIIRDDKARSYVFNQYGASGGGSGVHYIGTVGVRLYRAQLASTPIEIFDSTDFNDSTMNRGWVVIKYVD